MCLFIQEQLTSPLVICPKPFSIMVLRPISSKSTLRSFSMQQWLERRGRRCLGHRPKRACVVHSNRRLCARLALGGLWYRRNPCGLERTRTAIVSRCIEAYGVPKGALIGPCISTPHYETGEPVINALVENGFPRSVVQVEGTHKAHCNLRAAAEYELRHMGCTHIFHHNVCTYSTAELPSYRRNGKGAGRLLSIISLQDLDALSSILISCSPSDPLFEKERVALEAYREFEKARAGEDWKAAEQASQMPFAVCLILGTFKVGSFSFSLKREIMNHALRWGIADWLFTRVRAS